MKRIAARVICRPPRDGSEVKMSTGLSGPSTGRRSPSAVPQQRTPGNWIHDADQLWPDCRD